ncbi:hypothetical protein [Streptomyces platensis]
MALVAAEQVRLDEHVPTRTADYTQALRRAVPTWRAQHSRHTPSDQLADHLDDHLDDQGDLTIS